jgi:hypothetical protein
VPGCGQIESVVQNGQFPKQLRSCSRHPPWLSLRTARTGVTAAKPGRNRGHESVNSVCGRSDRLATCSDSNSAAPKHNS